MPALSAGNLAPEIALQDTKGGQFSLKEALKHGPVLLAFFKVSCPTCQFTLPYLERLYKGLKGKNVPSILGISQNGQRDTEAFLRQYGITFPVLLDDPKTYSVSNAYGITNVPTLFYIGPDETIEISSVGWSRPDLEEISQRAAQVAAIGKIAVIQPHEQVPESKAG
jgi:peroxiredoxin